MSEGTVIPFGWGDDDRGPVVEGIKVHPAADMFPMLDEQELRNLAADIEANGLRHPLVITPDGELIDGRNRRAACHLIGVEPSMEVYEGDPVAYIISTNIRRRHLTKGQRAMIEVRAAMLDGAKIAALPDGFIRAASDRSEVSDRSLQMASTVFRWASDLVDEVISGARSLTSAVEEARRRKDASTSAEARMAELRGKAPDLATQVEEEVLTLADALGAQKARETEDLKNRRVSTRLLTENIRPLADLRQRMGEQLDHYDPELAVEGKELSLAKINDAIAALRELRDIWNEKGME